MDRIIIYIVIGIVLLLSVSIIMTFLKRHYYLKILQMLKARQFNELEQLLESFTVKVVFSPFSLDYFKLNAVILKNDNTAINDMFELFRKRRLSKKQRELIYPMAFNYYINLKQYDKAKVYLDLINTKLSNEQMKNELNKIYDIFALKGYTYLESMLEELELIDDTYKGVNEYLISVMYFNKGDQENGEKYEKLSQEHMALLDKEIVEKHKSTH